MRSARAFARQLARGISHSENERIAVAPRRPRIGLALGGGFARGLAHIGVLKVLEEERIPIDFVAGTSVGAVMGAAYCSGISLREMEEIAGLVRFRDFARWTISRLGLCTNERMAAFLEKTLKAKTFEELKIPLAVTATDFTTGEGKVWTSGPLLDAVRASCAYPGMFLPVRVDGRLYVDGLLAYAVPTLPLRAMGAEKVLAIYLSSPWPNVRGPRHIFEIISQCFSIAESKSCGSWKAAADLILTPNVRGFTYDDFQKAKRLIASGEEAAREMLPQIREWLEPSQSAAEVIATTLPESSPAVPKAA